MVLEVVRTLLRRWYVVILGVLLTIGLVFGAKGASPPTYHARGLVLMLPSKVAVGKGGNPLLVLDGLEQPANIVIAYFASAPAHDAVAKISPTAQFTVLLDDSVRGPVVAVDVTDSSGASTMAVLNHLVQQIPQQLLRLQKQVKATPDSYMTSMVLSADAKPARNGASTVRMMIAALVIGVVGTVFGTVSLDSYLQRRATRNGEGAAGRRVGPRGRRSRGGDGTAPDGPQTSESAPGTDDSATAPDGDRAVPAAR